jgi:penicillin-binding protein 2
VLLTLLLVSASVLAGAMAGRGITPGSLYRSAFEALAPDDLLPAPEDRAGALAAATATPVDPALQGAGASPVSLALRPTPTPDKTKVELADPDTVAATWARRWSAGDWSGLYDLLAPDAQAAIEEQAFVDRYVAIADVSGLTSIVAEVAGGVVLTGDDRLAAEIDLTVTYDSSLVGAFTQRNTLPLTREEDGWRVAWTPSLIYAGLEDGCVDWAPDEVERGAILARDLEPLAYDGAISQIGIIPGQLTNEAMAVRRLASLLGMTPTEIQEKYRNGQPDWFMPIKEFPEEVSITVLEGIQNLDGVAVRKTVSRVYPMGAAAAHITGYVTPATAEDVAADPTLETGQYVGRTGLEAGADDLLRGTPGGELDIVDCGARTRRETIAARPGVDGADLVLTIDRDLQTATDAALGAGKGSAVVLDPRTGAVLALASHPTYDPNWFILGFTDEQWAFVNDESQRPLSNRATEAAYPTGSIFKVITMAAGMAYLGMDGSTGIDCPSTFTIPGTDATFRDWTVDEGYGAQGWMDLHTALVTSCNTVFYQLGYQLDMQDDDLLPGMTKAFGLGEATGIPFLYEIGGVVPDSAWKADVLGDAWATGDAINLSIGQGFLLATPLQMAVAYAAIANGGDVLQPYIVATTQRGEAGERQRVGVRTVRDELPLSRAQVAEIQSALRDQTSNTFGAGSSRVFADMAWPIAGKTGTAQNDLDRTSTPHSWFAAFGPYGDESTITSIVMFENAGEGVSYAAPATRKIYDAYVTLPLADT